ncbi:universal stress protein [Nocardia donostiensis]|uniref:Universal stress protein UspA n=1 Tax=Nocardia donostiensis TaxID=1538463 RepID=A0A1W0B061_9NOCA|nr:universal stress protein [Nocardia donostiensis]ONM50207.1 universal stress protein UspA [Nocardia donostiensis]OQS15868.1 universal stress protein UspA [Nocardia donostiensis]OQS23675.1 universal stress protein UspA [Nocardia donostiensis]
MPGSVRAPVLVGADGSPAAMQAVRWAAHEAACQRCALHIVYAVGVPIDVGPTFGYAPIDGETCRRAGQVTAEATRDVATAAAVPIADIEIETFVADAAPVPLLRDCSAHARLLVVGTRGLGAFRRGLLGSVSTSLARHARCPVAVVPEHPPDPRGPVVVGVDGSPYSARAIQIAFAVAARRDVELVAVHAWSEFYRYLSRDELQEEAAGLLAENLAGYRERYPDLRVRRTIVADRPARALLDAATDPQLLVVGSRGRGGFAGMTLGSVSQAVLHAAHCPVLIARASDRDR